MSIIDKLIWDTNFFKLNIGRVLVQDECTFDPNKFYLEAKNQFDLVYVFSTNKILPTNITSEANLELVDILLTMSMPLQKKIKSESSIELKTNLTESEIKRCYEIAEQTSSVSRFHREPLIGPLKAKNLYRRWIDNSLNSSFGDGILLEKSNGRIVGIHVIKTNYKEKTGTCSLIGVDKDYKGGGVGKNLWAQAITYWSSERVINKCKVPFSINNMESFNFHLKIGFNKIEEIKYIYHYRNSSINDPIQ